MGWTKRDIVKQAFSEIGKSDYDFDIQPEEMMSALRSLDSMVSTWGAQGIRIGYAGATVSAISTLMWRFQSSPMRRCF